MAIINTLITKLTVDNSEFKKGIQESQTSVNKFANSAKNGGIAIAATLAAAGTAFYTLGRIISESEEKISKLVDTSTRLGVGVEALQRLQYAAGQSGIDIDSLNGALGKMEKNLGLAINGSTTAAQAFTSIGLSIKDLAAMNADQQYLAISDAIKQITNPAQQAAAAVAIFGKGGIQQLSLLKDNVRGMVEEFKGLGVELTTNQAKAVEAFGDRVRTLGVLWDGFKNQLTVALEGPLTQMILTIEDNIKAMGGMSVVAKKAADGIIVGFNAAAAVINTLTTSMSGFYKIAGASALWSAIKDKNEAERQMLIANKSGDVDRIKKAGEAYQAQNLYVQTLRETINKATTAKEEFNKAGGISSSSLTSSPMQTPAKSELDIQTQITEGYKAQLELIKSSVAEQQKKVQGMADEKAKLDDLVNSRGGENERLRTSVGQAQQLADEVARMKQQGPQNVGVEGNRYSTLDTSVIDQLIQDFKDLHSGITQDDVSMNRLAEITDAFNILNDPKNQFGAGNTDRQQKQELKLVIQAQDGFEAKVANSSANLKVITDTLNKEITNAARQQ